MPWLAFIPVAFLCGAVPFGLIIARSRGVDIRKHGSGNIGATNVWRTLGRGPGLACFILDVLKGTLPVLAAGAIAGLLGDATIAPRDAWLWLAVMAAAIMGHMFTPFAGFKGGKGVATGLGAMLGVYPHLTFAAVGALAVWIAAALIWRYVSLASCLAALALPAIVFVVAHLGGRAQHGGMVPFYAVSGALGLLVIVRHRSNLKRLMSGTENRIGANRV
jgi:acyl phosphate:glycerol-3-phosphate acyltransferase